MGKVGACLTRAQHRQLEDKLRVLRNIAVDTARSSHDRLTTKGPRMTLSILNKPAPQFMDVHIAKSIGQPLRKGDIVKCQSNPNHPHGISEFVYALSHADYILREIGTGIEIAMRNESLDVLRFMAPHRLYTGRRYQLYLLTLKAFSSRYNPKADHKYRPGSIEVLTDPKEIRAYERAHVWYQETPEGFTRPRLHTIPYNSSTRLKDIVNAMLANGFGTPFNITLKESAS